MCNPRPRVSETGRSLPCTLAYALSVEAHAFRRGIHNVLLKVFLSPSRARVLPRLFLSLPNY